MSHPTEHRPSRTPDDRYRHLPAPVRLEDTITSTDPDAPPDPTCGRDTERDFMLRYAG